MITVFTPTYNRKKELGTLIESLKKQSNLDFEWVVVDDGSSDGTKEYIEEIKENLPFSVNYRYVENGGKMRAINHGMKMAQGEYFFIVDSDDFLSENAIETVYKYGKQLPLEMGGMVFRKINKIDGKVSGKAYPQHSVDSTPIDIVYKLGIIGDKAEVFRTDILKQYPFQVFENEKFVPEASVWIKIGQKHKLRYIDEGIYYFEYLPSGYTNSFNRLIKNNPQGFAKYYKEMIGYDIPFKNKLKFLIRLIQCKLFILLGGKK